eukprot:204535_1
MAILERIKRENAVNEFLCKKNDKSYLEETLTKVLNAIEKRLPFSQDMLSLSWEYCWHYRDTKEDILESKLWKTIAQQMLDIIGNMQTMQRDFLWLTTGRLNVIMMELKINDNGKQWDDLQAYGLEDDFVMVSDQEEEEKTESTPPRRPDVRQDTTEHPLKPEYNEHALRRLNAVIGKAGANMIDHYNETVYLGQLHMKNTILNDDFQHSVEHCYFISKRKISHLNTMMKALQIIEGKISKGEGYNIKRVLRKKNLFREYSFENPAYFDVKLNVEVFRKSVESISIVAEVQVMVPFMNTFKKEVSHKLYQIQRQQEHFEKMTKISKKLTEFEPNFTAILATGKVRDLCKYMIEHIMDTQFVINYRFQNKANIFHAIFRFDNIAIYKYLTRPGQSVPVTDKVLRAKFAEKDGRGSHTFYELLKSNSK